MDCGAISNYYLWKVGENDDILKYCYSEKELKFDLTAIISEEKSTQHTNFPISRRSKMLVITRWLYLIRNKQRIFKLMNTLFVLFFYDRLA